MPQVLFVDSEDSVRSAARKIFTHAGYKAITAGNMIDAKALLSANDFDMAIINRQLKDNNNQKESCDIFSKEGETAC